VILEIGLPPVAKALAKSVETAVGDATANSIDCSSCGRRTRVTYAEFAALHFPLWAWIPTPARTHRHWMRCPACHRFTWLRAGWLE